MVTEPQFTMTSQALSPTQEERNWAMLAHLTALLSAFVAVSTGGIGYVFALLAPLALYLYFSGRSRYIAYHALQATVFQALAGVAYVIVAGAAGAAIAAAWTVAGVLTVILVGVLLMPLALGVTLLAGVLIAGLPLLGLGYALRGAYLTYHGQDFDYPWIGTVVARSLTPDTGAG